MKLLSLILIVLFLTSCVCESYIDTEVIVVEKHHIRSYTSYVYINKKIVPIYHPSKYYFTVNNDGKILNEYTDYETYMNKQIGDKISIKVCERK